ncbi:MAG: adenine nucleotide alpha hydrolase [Planctomycetota bacterium]|nr:MAG: adenine nucleotide alpha hydrolase [Planctomycetota bacterium]
MTGPKVLIAWSSGKDSAWALHVTQQGGGYEIAGLLTTVTETYGRVSMHGVREELLEAQAEALDLPLYRVNIPASCTDEDYNNTMRKAMESAAADGITHVIFGDVFLEDIRSYREDRLAEIGMTGVFPLWKLDTGKLAREMIANGLRAYVTCLDPGKLPRDFAGREYNSEFLEDLPENTDPCGENGEFHTFVFNGPMFRHAIKAKVGKTVDRDGFVFTDITKESMKYEG